MSKVSAGAIPGESARAVLEELVRLTPEQAARIIGPAESFEAPAPAPTNTPAPDAAAGME